MGRPPLCTSGPFFRPRSGLLTEGAPRCATGGALTPRCPPTLMPPIGRTSTLRAGAATGAWRSLALRCAALLQVPLPLGSALAPLRRWPGALRAMRRPLSRRRRPGPPPWGPRRSGWPLLAARSPATRPPSLGPHFLATRPPGVACRSARAFCERSRTQSQTYPSGFQKTAIVLRRTTPWFHSAAVVASSVSWEALGYQPWACPYLVNEGENTGAAQSPERGTSGESAPD